MATLFNLFTDPLFLFSIVVIVTLAIFTVIHFNINVKSSTKDIADKAVSYQIKKDLQRTKKRQQADNVGKKQSRVLKKYRKAVSGIKSALNVSFLTVENFTTIFVLFGFLVWVLFSFLLNNIFLGSLVAVPSIFGLLAFLLVITKRRVRANDNAVMDALDSICPSMHLHVTSAVKVNLDSFDRRVKHHFEWFVNAVEYQNYSVGEALSVLNARLGPRFDDFAQKARIYEDAARDGMEDIFKDIVEMNNEIREDNADLDTMYAEKNTKLLQISALLVGFLMYMYIAPLTRDFMLNSFLGTFIAAVEVAALILIYAISQFMQVDLPADDSI